MKERDDYGLSAKELLKHSWLFDGLRPEIRDELIDNPDFMINGGLSTSSSPSVSDPSRAYERHQAHVMRSLASWSVWMQHNAYRHYEWGGDLTSSIPQNPEERVLLNVYLGLYQHLQNKLGQGETLKELARCLRPAEWGLEKELPGGVVAYRILRIGDREIFVPNRVYTGYEAGKAVWELAQLSDEEFEERLGRVREFPPYGYKPTALTNEELEKVNKDVFVGFQPDLHIDIPVNWKDLYWGVYLERLEPDEIDVLADKAEYCSDGCQFYHGRVRFLKELEELIAPVDAELFGAALLKRYQKWRENVQEEERRFRVLIPAQADGTTIGGILDYLDDHGISQEEVIEKFSFELADLCVIPLLRVYAELKRRKLLQAMGDNIQIRSMDAFRWPQEEAKFDFICTDHFIDLFPPEGEFSQKNLLLSLVKSLAPGGQIVLTARCGSLERPLETQDILDGFYEKVDRHIEGLLEQLKEERDISLVHELIALLLYRQLREVYPFKTEKDLGELLDEVSNCSGKVIGCQIERLEEGKVKIVITKSQSK